VHGLPGAKWDDSVAFLSRVFVYSQVCALQSKLFVMPLVIGRPATDTRIQAIVTAIYLPSLVVLSGSDGVQGALAAVVGSAVLGLVPLYVNFFRETGIGPQAYSACWIRPSLAAGLAAALAYTTVALIDPEPSVVGAVIQLLVGTAVGLLTYSLVLTTSWSLARRDPTAT
jgi:hypothetical protein